MPLSTPRPSHDGYPTTMSFDAHGTMYAEAPAYMYHPGRSSPGAFQEGQRFDRSVVEHLERFRLILDHGISSFQPRAAFYHARVGAPGTRRQPQHRRPE